MKLEHRSWRAAAGVCWLMACGASGADNASRSAEPQRPGEPVSRSAEPAPEPLTPSGPAALADPDRRSEPRPGNAGKTDYTFRSPAPLTPGMIVRQRFEREHVRLSCLAAWKQGRMQILFAFDGSGRFTRREIVEDTMEAPGLTACVRRALDALDGAVIGPEVANRSFVLTLSPPDGNPVVER